MSWTEGYIKIDATKEHLWPKGLSCSCSRPEKTRSSIESLLQQTGLLKRVLLI